MILLGLTGGIGSGKSTVSELLSQKGAVIVDADVITRELQAPGQPLLDAIANRFGVEVIGPDGSLVRQALADKVFGDPDALKDLNAIVHPAVGKEMNRRIDAERDKDSVVVLDIPLLVENPRKGLSGVVVVDVDIETAVSRLTKHRGMDEKDARSRIERQASREQRREIADRVLDNSGTLENLKSQVDEMWTWVLTLEHAGPDAGEPMSIDATKK